MNREQRERSKGCGSTSSNKLKTNRLTGAILLGSTVFLCAGELAFDELEAPQLEAADAGGGFCDAYRSIGKLYANPENPFIQELSLFGRAHYQYGVVSGNDATGRNFDYDTAEFRRFRNGVKGQVLNYFNFKGQTESSYDEQPRGGDKTQIRFQHFWDLFVTFDAQAAFGIEAVDTLKFGYGSREVHTSSEWDISSNKLKTVERSAISNKIWGQGGEFDNPTGAWITIGKDTWESEFGVFTTTQGDFWAPWADGQYYWASHHHDLTEFTGAKVSDLFLTGFYQNSDSSDPFEILGDGMEWGLTAAITYGRGPWQFILEGLYGSNGTQSNAERGGHFWGVVFLPSIWVIEDKLEAVARYHYQASEDEQGIRLNSRYARRAESSDSAVDINGGRGDEHHAYYVGLKYHFCKDNIHALIGLEYDDINSGGEDVYDGWSTLFTLRTFF